jgi:hypothetical protein
MATAVFGIASTYRQAETIVEELKEEGFANTDISVLFANQRGAREFVQGENTTAPDDAVARAGTGGAFGGVLGWLAGMGSLAIPGVGPFIAAGPIMAALGGAAVGSAVGGFVGALMGMGISENEAQQYESKLRDGHVLISVHWENSAETDGAEKVLKRSNAYDISCTTETSVKRSTDSLPHPGLA